MGILINVIFYSCSAVSRTKHMTCKNDRDIHGIHKLSPWKTIEFKVYFKNGLKTEHGYVHIKHSKSVSCTDGQEFFDFKTKSCANWSFRRRKTLRYKVVCIRRPPRKPPKQLFRL